MHIWIIIKRIKFGVNFQDWPRVFIITLSLYYKKVKATVVATFPPVVDILRYTTFCFIESKLLHLGMLNLEGPWKTVGEVKITVVVFK